MYARETSREMRIGVLIRAMRDIKLCAMVSSSGDGLQASHLPVVVEHRLDDTVIINGHVARNNPHWQAINGPSETIALFQGPHGYISPSWYQAKSETGKVVPTWGYIAVHAHGRLEVIKDIDWLRSHVGALTDLHECGRPDPWAVSDAPEDYIGVMLRGIIGLRLTVERLEGSWKINQHRSASDQRGVIAGLLSEPAAASRHFAATMETALTGTKPHESSQT